MGEKVVLEKNKVFVQRDRADLPKYEKEGWKEVKKEDSKGLFKKKGK